MFSKKKKRMVKAMYKAGYDMDAMAQEAKLSRFALEIIISEIIDEENGL